MSVTIGTNSIESTGELAINNTSGQNVGIHTNNPVYELDLTKDQNNATVFRVLNNTTGSAAQTQMRLDGDSGSLIFKQFSSGFTTSGSNQADAGQIFANDALSNGLNIVSNNDLKFWTGGTAATSATERMRINSSGYVGIGTNNPANFLHIEDANTGFAPLLTLQNRTAGTGAASRMRIECDTGHALIFDVHSSTYTTSGLTIQDGARIVTDGGLAGGLTLQAIAGDIRFGTGTSNERMRILSGGNVGIGTTNPDTELHVYNSTGATQLTIENTNTVNGSRLDLVTNGNDWIVGAGGSTNTGTPNSLYFYDLTNDGYYMTITNTGNVGIGTATPNDLLDIRKDQNATTTARILNNNNSAAAIAELWVQGNGGNVYLRNYSAGYTTAGANVADSALLFADDSLSNGLGIAANNDIVFYAGGTSAANTTERMRIESGGDVGIGTNDPEFKLHVYETANGAAGMEIENPNTGTAAFALFNVKAQATNFAIRQYSSNVSTNGAIRADSTLFLSNNGTGGFNYVNTGGPHRFYTGGSNAGDTVLRATIEEDWGIILATGTPSTTTNVLYNVGGSLFFNGSAVGSSSLWTESGGEIYRLSNVGIGTNNPSTTLEVYGTSASGASVTINATTDNATFNIQADTTNAESGSSDAEPRIGLFSGGTTNSELKTVFGYNTVSDGFQISNAPTNIVIDTATPHFFIAASGNVGIGTTNPAQELDVNGDVEANRFFVDDSNYANGFPLNIETGTAWASQAGDKMIVNSYQTGSAREFTIGLKENQGSSPYIQMHNTNNTANSDYIIFGTQDSEQMRMNYQGNLGIGTNAPATKLHIASGAPTAVNVSLLTLLNGDGTGEMNAGVATNNSTNIDFVFQDSNPNFTPQAQIKALLGENPDDGQDAEGSGNLVFLTALGSGAGGSLNEVMRLSYQGNVGIGSTLPAYMLDVAGDINFTGTLRQNGTAFSGGSGAFTEDSTTQAHFNTSNNASVGIGTSTPVGGFHGSGDSVLHIHGGSLNRGSAAHFTVDDAPTSGFLVGVGNGNDARLETQSNESITFYTNATERFQIRNDGQIIISGTGQFFLSNTNPKLNFGTSGNHFINLDSNELIFQNNSAERMRIDSSGYVGIGTNNPVNSRMHIQQTDGATSNLFLTNNSNTNSQQIPRFTTRQYTSVNDDVMMLSGLYNNGNNILYVGGGISQQFCSTRISFWATGSVSTATGTEVVRFDTTSNYALKIGGGSWGTLSDRRIKQNERAITDPLDKIYSLQPKHFEYINTGEFGHPEGTRTGFIAQEFEQVFPGHITEVEPMIEADKDTLGEGEKVKSIDTDLIPYLVAAMKELVDKIKNATSLEDLQNSL